MKLLSRHERAREALVRAQSLLKTVRPGIEIHAIATRVAALPDNATPEMVDEATGGQGWTSVYCEECRQAVAGDVIQLGEENGCRDCGEFSAVVCLACLRKAVELAEGL